MNAKERPDLLGPATGGRNLDGQSKPRAFIMRRRCYPVNLREPRRSELQPMGELLADWWQQESGGGHHGN